MPKTVVGLFENARTLDGVAREIEALGFPRQEVRIMRQPANLVTGVMSFLRGRRGGALAFATGSDNKVETAGNTMNQPGAVEVADLTGPEPQLPRVTHQNTTLTRDGSVMAGRIRQTGGEPVVLCGNPYNS